MRFTRTERRGALLLFSGDLSASFAGGTIEGQWNLDTGDFAFNRDLAGALAGQRQWFRGRVASVGGRLVVLDGTWGGYNEGAAPNDWRAVATGQGAVSAPPPPPSAGGAVAGLWRGQNGVEFQIAQQGSQLTWRADSIGQTGLGYVVGDRVTLNWNGPQGYTATSGRMSGNRIEFDDGTWMERVR